MNRRIDARFQPVLSVPRTAGMNRAQAPSLLADLIYDVQGERLVPSHAVKRGKRYRYYISKRLNLGQASDNKDVRIPAKELEHLVWQQVRDLLSDQTRLLAILQTVTPDGLQQRAMLGKAAELVSAWPQQTVHERRAVITTLFARILLQDGQLEVRLLPHALANTLGLALTQMLSDAEAIVLTAPLNLRRIGYEMRLVVHGAFGKPEPNAALIS